MPAFFRFKTKLVIPLTAAINSTKNEAIQISVGDQVHSDMSALNGEDAVPMPHAATGDIARS
jgi:hypothetical protein